MEARFGLHRIWFCYTDERTASYELDNCIAPCKEIYDNEKEALEEATRLDLEIVKSMSFYSLWRMFEFDTSKLDSIINVFYSSGWKEHLSIEEIDFPLKLLSEQQLLNFRRLSKVSFHQVIEHKTYSHAFFVRLSEEFWSKTLLDYLLYKKHITDSKNASVFDPKEFEEYSEYASDLWINSNRISGLFLYDRKTNKAILSSEAESWERMAYLLIDLFRLYPRENMLYEKGIKELTKYPNLSELVIKESGQLTKYIDFIQKDKDSLGTANFNLQSEKLTKKEILIIKNFILSLKLKPFDLYNRLESVNGQVVHNTRIYHEHHF